MLFAAGTSVVGVMLVSGCVPEKEIAANVVTESMVEVKPMIFTVLEEPVRKPVREDFAQEKTQEDRVTLRATTENTEPKKKSASFPSAKEETSPVPETQGEIKNKPDTSSQ